MAKRRPSTEITRCPWSKGDDYIEFLACARHLQSLKLKLPALHPKCDQHTGEGECGQESIDESEEIAPESSLIGKSCCPIWAEKEGHPRNDADEQTDALLDGTSYSVSYPIQDVTQEGPGLYKLKCLESPDTNFGRRDG